MYAVEGISTSVICMEGLLCNSMLLQISFQDYIQWHGSLKQKYLHYSYHRNWQETRNHAPRIAPKNWVLALIFIASHWPEFTNSHT